MKKLFLISLFLVSSLAHARPLLNHVCLGFAIDGSEVLIAVQTYIQDPNTDLEIADIAIRIEDRSPDDQSAIHVQRIPTEGYLSWKMEGIGFNLDVMWYANEPIGFYHGMEFPEQSILLQCQKRQG